MARDFKSFSDLVHTNLKDMSSQQLFLVEDIDDAIYTEYLAAFPEGQNPVLIERTEHDCSCCKQFIRNIGAVVSIKDGAMRSVWDIEGAPYPYDVVARTLSDLVKHSKVVSVFFTDQAKHGAKTSKRMLGDTVVTNNHFYCELESRHVCSGSVAEKKGSLNTSAQVLQRSLDELSLDAVSDVLDLIQDKDDEGNSGLYRGEEHLTAVKDFKALLTKYNTPSNVDKSLFAWEHSGNLVVSRFKNTVIGTLVSDLSNGVDVTKAVKSFGDKVAPTNYKRPKSVITKKMSEDAIKTIDELGVRESLERRFAVVSDVKATDVLFVDRDVQPLMKDSLLDALMGEVKSTPIKEDNATNISIDDFMQNIVPKTSSMELYLKNSQKVNFFSLTAPVNEDAKNIFQWGNSFSWAYDGDIADSDIKQRVKSAGGNVTAPFRVSLGWFNFDDLDIHVIEPSGNEIWYNSKRSSSGGFLDIDMNAGGQSSRDAVENICWNKPPDGDYKVYVKQYQRRESIDVGFELEVENNGSVSNYKYEKPVVGKKLGLTISVKSGNITNIETAKDIFDGSSPQEKWGVTTESFTKVNMMMHSPNHWEGSNTGNKHYFFVLDKCKNPDKVRGFFNEHLSPDFHKHRKVFEILGSRTKCEEAEEQLSGVGFSSTKNDTVLIKVVGENSSRLYNVKF